MANELVCTCCGQPLTEHTRILRAVRTALIGLLSMNMKEHGQGRKWSTRSVVDLGDKVAEGLVPYIIQAAYPSEGDTDA